MTTTKINNKGLIAGLLTAAAASLCCITPVLAFLAGASVFSSSFTWIEPFRPYLIGITVFVFAFAWYQKLKPKQQIDCDCESDNKKSFWQSKLFLGIVTLVACLIISFPFYANVFVPKHQKIKVMEMANANIQQVVFKIKGMTCESCTHHINAAISKLNGIVAFQTSYENENSTVKFDKNKTSVDNIVAVINSTGYRVVSHLVTTEK